MREQYGDPISDCGVRENAAYQSIRESMARLSGIRRSDLSPDILVAEILPTDILMY